MQNANIKRAIMIRKKNDRKQKAYDAIVLKLRQEDCDAIARLQIAIDNTSKKIG